MKLYVDIADCAAANPTSLNPVLAFHWDGVPVEEREAAKGSPSSPFTLVDNPEDADLFVLPREWNYYLWHGKRDEAEALAERARKCDKRILIWFRGDLSPVIDLPNAVVFKSAMDRSRRKAHEYAAPYFIDDPARTDAGAAITVRTMGSRPVVGFCGYAAVNPIKIAYGIATNFRNNLTYLAGRSKYEPVPIVPATMLRAKALDLLARDRRVDANFVIRDRHRAGFTRKDSSAGAVAATAEFFDNIAGSDYTLCVRGNGNWSIRLYETLACGRIPVFVDTDCVLPYESTVDWKRYCVWVDEAEVRYIGEKVAEFHDRLSPDDFVELQRACRTLWQERLSFSGFMNHLPEHFPSEAWSALPT